MGRCGGLNKNGNECGNYAIKGTQRCRFHSIVENSTFNNECPICFESEEEMIVLNCFHKLHEECCKGLNKLECPMCRTPITNIPSHLKNIIVENTKKYKQEQETEERQRILENEAMSASQEIRYSPRLEVASAIMYLKEELQIPVCFLPIDIIFTTDIPPPQGVIFHTIVFKVLHDINNLLLSGETPYDDIFAADNCEEDSEDIFPEEGMTLEILQPNFEIRKS